MPMVDDPFDFGRIAATNAISDIYAMGGKPVMALAILGMPIGKLSVDTVREILNGGASVCAAAGIPVAGGHSIDCPEPVYGLAVVGICRPEHVRRNDGARVGDTLILTKPVGVGIYSAAFKKDALAPESYAEMVAAMTLLNSIGADLAKNPDVHAITDVTGFGLLGHAMEMARGSGHTLIIRDDEVPLLADAERLAREGYITGASGGIGRAMARASSCQAISRNGRRQPIDRSSNIRRAADFLRAGAGGYRIADDRCGRLSRGSHYRSGVSRRSRHPC